MWGRLLIGAAVAATVVGCSSAGTPTTTAQNVVPGPATTTVVQTGTSNGLYAVAGTYALAAIDNHALPYALPSKEPGLQPTTIMSGTLTINVTGTFGLSTTYRAVEDRVERSFNDQFTGACARDGDAFRMFWEGGGETAVNVAGDTLVMDRDGVRFRYVKRP
jgi:hypothetical protein